MVTVSTRRSTRALSIDVALTHLLSQGATRARVHSVFRHVINVMTPAGQLISLCGHDHDDAPWSLRADVDVWTEWAIQTGEEVQATRDGLTLPAGRVSLTGAQAWDAAATPMTAHPTQLTARAHELASVIRAVGVPGGALSGPSPDPFGALVSERIRRGLSDIVAGDLVGHASDVEAAASSLLGLGPGLTPAGDDALTGLALVVARPGSLATTVLPALRRVLQHHADHTTALSSATLSSALDGRARQRLVDLVDVLVSRDDSGAALLRGHAERVLGIGHTSGTDIACGVLAGIELEIQRRGSA